MLEKDIAYTQLIITCEACGSVKRYMVRSKEESDRIFREFRCENGCGRNLYSSITLGTLSRPAGIAEQAESANKSE
jgi:hypothetical protein